MQLGSFRHAISICLPVSVSFSHNLAFRIQHDVPVCLSPPHPLPQPTPWLARYIRVENRDILSPSCPCLWDLYKVEVLSRERLVSLTVVGWSSLAEGFPATNLVDNSTGQ